MEKRLKKGYTTGTCAQAATKAAVKMLFTGEKTDRIEVELPCAKKLQLKVHDIEFFYEEGRNKLCQVSCAIQKDSGDDPDVTNGILIYSTVSRTEDGEITLEGGEGIGRVTKPGLEQEIGQAAINKIPRKMILKEVEEACEEYETGCGVHVLISIPEGRKLAAKTFNPRLGIEGGLSVLGTSGVVEPMSEQALLDTIRLEMKIKRAEGRECLIITPGNYGLDFLEREYGIHEKEVVKCSNYIGQTLDMAVEQEWKELVLVGHIGKLVKVSGGIMNTHSRWADCRMELLAAAGIRAGLSSEKLQKLLDSVTTDDALSYLTEEERKRVMDQVMKQMMHYLDHRLENKLSAGAIIYSNEFGVLAKSESVDKMLGRSSR